MNNKAKHLEFIQNVIKRLSSNSFYIKGWTISLVAILSTLVKENNSKQTLLISLVVVIFFWYLDSYYLFQERLYRKLYDVVRGKEEKNIDYSMNAKPNSRGWLDHLKAFFSKTLLTYYPLVLLIIVITFFQKGLG